MNVTIGDRIKAARKEAGMTQKELGAALGISFQAVAQWENNLRNPKVETVLKIAKVLNVNPQRLLLQTGHSELYRDVEAVTTIELEQLLELHFAKLNRKGKETAVQRIKELTMIPEYCENNGLSDEVGNSSKKTPAGK